MKHSSIVLAALIAATGTVVHAQQEWTEMDDDSFMIESLGMTVEELDDASIYDSTGERIGELDDVLMGPDSGNMAVSLDVGGFLGIGEKDVVLPMGDLSRTADGDIMIDMTKEQLEALPEYED